MERNDKLYDILSPSLKKHVDNDDEEAFTHELGELLDKYIGKKFPSKDGKVLVLEKEGEHYRIRKVD